jgi:hypothetical protein
MKNELKQKQIKELEKELEEDLDFLLNNISKIKEEKKENWETSLKNLENSKTQLEKNLVNIQVQLDPIMQGSDHDSYMLITEALINQTIEEYFYYHIRTHPDMEKALEDFENNGEECLKNYSTKIKKWISIFSTKTYKENKKAIDEEWIIHKTWVCIDEPGDPFSFKNCLDYRGNADPEKLRNYLDDLCNWDLELLMKRYELFHYSTKKKEKETILSLRTEQ